MTAEEAPNAEFSIVRNASPNQRIVLNVGGERHDVPWETLARFPNSRLGRLKDCWTHEELRTLCDDYSLEENEYYFNWQTRCFKSILRYYRTGRLHVNGEVCALSFAEDLKYWGLDDSCLASCCQGKHLQETEDLKEEMRNRFILMRDLKEKEFGIHGRSKFQNYMWNLLENPKSSLKARVLRCVSIIIIIIAGLLNLVNMYVGRVTYETSFIFLFILDIGYTSWFILEYLLRITFSPRKCIFFFSVLNIIDFLFILQNFMSIIIISSFIKTDIVVNKEVTTWIYIFENIRILIIVKLARHLKGFRILGLTMFKSSKILGMLMLFLFTGIVVFSSLIYLENNIREYFYSPEKGVVSIEDISDVVWWSTVAMVSGNTCGSGKCPESSFSKIVAVACVLCGVVVVTLPIPVVISNFEECFRIQRMQEIISKRHHVIQEHKEKDFHEDLQSLSTIVCQK